MTNPLETTTKESYYLIDFRYGEKGNYQYHRVTDWTADVQLTAEPLYTSLPGIEVKPGKRVGDLNEETCKFKLRRGTSGFFFDISTGDPHSRVHVVLRQAFAAGGGTQVLTLFRGHLGRVVRNADGKTELIRLECVNWRRHLGVPLGMGANPRCPWTHGDKNCQRTVAVETGTLTTIDGTSVTITGLAAHSDLSFWHRGFVKKDGLRLLIRDWDGSTSFELERQPPASWASSSVDVVEGCDKKLKTCRDDKDNEKRFGGIGKNIPKHHPMFENPSG